MQCVLCASQTSISFLVFIWCSVWLFEVITRMVWAISNYSTLTLKCAKLLYIIIYSFSPSECIKRTMLDVWTFCGDTYCPLSSWA